MVNTRLTAAKKPDSKPPKTANLWQAGRAINMFLFMCSMIILVVDMVWRSAHVRDMGSFMPR